MRSTTNAGTSNAPPRSAVSLTTRASSSVGAGRMLAVSVGGFEQQHVGLRHRLGIGQDRPVVATQVAGEHDPRTRAELQVDRRGPEDVAGTAVGDA